MAFSGTSVKRLHGLNPHTDGHTAMLLECTVAARGGLCGLCGFNPCKRYIVANCG